MLTQTELQTRRSNMLQLWLLIALFALPPIAAWLFYLNPQWLPAGRTNHGQLIEPPRAMQELALRTPGGEKFDWDSLQGQWTLCLLAEGQCEARCMQQLIKLRQIRRALGANRQRVERLLILLPDSSGQVEIPTLGGLEGTRLALTTKQDKPNLLAQFAIPGKGLDQTVFLIDPRADLMMAQDLSHTTSKQVLQDLEKLLKASQSWVKGGQYGHQ
ncbi:MAG: hypothetical protein PVG22_08370 [Chromatiales bacterium]